MTKAIIEAQRAGYVAGAQAAAGSRWTPAKQLKAIAEAEVQFPMTEERPRVVSVELPVRALPPGTYRRVPPVPGFIEYRVNNGVLESRNPSIRSDAPAHIQRWAQQWRKSHLTLAVLLDLQELFAKPTETVEVTQ